MSQWVKFKFQYLSNCFACTLRTISLVIRCMLFCFSPLHCLLRIEPLQLLSISLFWVVHFASPKVLPIVFNFFSLFLFQLWNVLPWFLCPCGFQSDIFCWCGVFQCVANPFPRPFLYVYIRWILIGVVQKLFVCYLLWPPQMCLRHLLINTRILCWSPAVSLQVSHP